jgi:predicted Zn-dependent protease
MPSKPTKARAAKRPALGLLLAALLAGCSSIGQVSPQLLPGESIKQAELSPAAQREHQRILAAYGGAYENPRLQALLGQMVDRLVAASDRPDLRYRVVILDSPAVNAFALPPGQLYVTCGTCVGAVA